MIDPQPFSEDEDRAAEAGLQSLQTGDGAAIRSTSASPAPTRPTAARSIPSFQPDREEFLEYDVAKLIQELGDAEEAGHRADELAADAGPVQSHDRADGRDLADPRRSSSSSSRCAPLTTDVDHIDKDVDVLMIVHPKHLAPKTLYAIDQFVMRGGKSAAVRRSGQRRRHQRPGSVESVRRRDGQSFLGPGAAARRPGASPTIPTKVVGDLDLGLEVRSSMQGPPTRHIGILGLRRDDMDRKDVVTASLDVDQRGDRRLPGAAPRRQRPRSSRCCMSSDQRRADARRALQRR